MRSEWAQCGRKKLSKSLRVGSVSVFLISWQRGMAEWIWHGCRWARTSEVERGWDQALLMSGLQLFPLCLPPFQFCSAVYRVWQWLRAKKTKGTLTFSQPWLELTTKANAAASLWRLGFSLCPFGLSTSFGTGWASGTLSAWWAGDFLFYNWYEKSSAHTVMESEAK